MTRPLRVGIQLPEVERLVPWHEYVAMARAAEESGFDSIWVGDHLLYRGDDRPERGPWESWTLLAALAAVTERIRVGPLVACVAFHPPAVLAKMAATLAEVADGRFTLGLGAGWNEEEFRAFGIPFDHRASRFEESFQVIRRLLAAERLTYEGRFVRVRDAVLIPPPRRPALMIGSTGERVLSAALPHVDAWNTWYDRYGNRPEGFEKQSARVTALAERVGRDPSAVARSACVLVVLDRSAAERPLEDVSPVEGGMEGVAAHLHELANAGADEAILVAAPITEASIRSLGEALTILDA